jgi:hypothetical protein
MKEPHCEKKTEDYFLSSKKKINNADKTLFIGVNIQFLILELKNAMFFTLPTFRGILIKLLFTLPTFRGILIQLMKAD